MPSPCGQRVDGVRKADGITRVQSSTDSYTYPEVPIKYSEQVQFSHDLSDSFHSSSPHKKSLIHPCLNTFFTQFPQPLLLQQRS